MRCAWSLVVHRTRARVNLNIYIPVDDEKKVRKMYASLSNPFEIIVGTYEQYLLGYKVQNIVNVSTYTLHTLNYRLFIIAINYYVLLMYF